MIPCCIQVGFSFAGKGRHGNSVLHSSSPGHNDTWPFPIFVTYFDDTTLLLLKRSVMVGTA